jgi:DNA-binding IclR family transcriptional regulator
VSAQAGAGLVAAPAPPRHVGNWDGERTRTLLLEHLRREPGLHKSSLCRAAGVPWGTLNHHLRRMVREGQVHVRGIGNRVHLFPGPAPPLLGAALGAAGASLLACLRRDGPLRVCDLCARLGRSRKAVYGQLRRLMELGLVAADAAPQRRYRLAQAEGGLP